MSDEPMPRKTGDEPREGGDPGGTHPTRPKPSGEPHVESGDRNRMTEPAPATAPKPK